MQFGFREICHGVDDRNNFENISYQNMSKYSGKTDVFYSMFLFEQDNAYSSQTIDHVVIDFDILNLDVVDAACQRIENKLNIEYLMYFSGNKGFHIILPNVWNFTEQDIQNKTMRETITNTFPYADPSIYHKRSIIRMPNTIHSKTGLYKRIVSRQLFSKGLNAVYDLAKCPYLHFKLPEKKNVTLNKIYSIGKKLTKTQYDVEHMPSPKCVHSILRNKPIEGERHIASLRIMSHLLHYLYLPTFAVAAMVKNWWLQSGELTDKQSEWIDRSVNDVQRKYRYGCNDTYLANRCSSFCLFRKGKNYMSNGRNLREIFDNYKKKMEQGLFYDLSEIYPALNSEFIVYSNDLLGIIGAPGVGKSTMAMDIILRLLEKKPDDFVLWSNLDNSDDLLVRRILQHKAELKKNELLKKSNSVRERIANVFNLIENSISLEDLTNVDELRHKLEQPEQYWPRKPSIWVIDHVGNLNSKAVGGYDRMRELGDELKRIPKEHDILVIAIGHINKNDGRMGTMNVHSVRDANIGEASDVLLGLRSVHKENEISRVAINAIKARDNIPFEVQMYYDARYCKFKEELEEENNEQVSELPDNVVNVNQW